MGHSDPLLCYCRTCKVYEHSVIYIYILENEYRHIIFHRDRKSILPEATLGRILHGELSPVLCCVSILGRLFGHKRVA